MVDVAMRFDDGIFEDPMAELMQLRQVGNLNDYLTAFDELAARIGLNDKMALSCFLGGLSKPLEMAVIIQRPKLVMEAMQIAKWQEGLLLSLTDKTAVNTKPVNNSLSKPNPYAYKNTLFTPSNQSYSYNQKPASPNRTTNSINTKQWQSFNIGSSQSRNSSLFTSLKTNIPHTSSSKTTYLPSHKQPNQNSKGVTLAEERISKGLCWVCGEKWSPQYLQECKRYKVFSLILEEKGEGGEGEVEEDSNYSVQLAEFEEMRVSLNAIKGNLGDLNLILEGIVKKWFVQFLVDMGSTHNFLTERLVKMLGLKPTYVGRLYVRVANEQWLTVTSKVVGLGWKIQDQFFQTDFFVLPVMGMRAILSTQWLRSLGKVGLDFETLTLDFVKRNEVIVLRGLDCSKLVKQELSEVMKIGTTDEVYLLQVQTMDGIDTNSDKLSTELNELEIDQLKEKNVIEKMVSEMLESGVIRNSTSAFAAPVVLVKKKDNTWRFCVDYRKLNTATIKDKFPIPIVKELIDELYRANYFSKLDLRSGYHQVRMHSRDVHKTTFKTHSVPNKWVEWLGMAEFWYNTHYQASIKMTPFEALYGYAPNLGNPYVVGTSMLQAVETTMRTREQILALLKQNLMKAQERMKFMADKKRSEREFKVGDWVFLKLQPYRQSSINNRPFHKLSALYYGPYQVLERIGNVAYKLALPSDAKIHDVFHVSLLKKHHGQKIPQSTLPPFSEEGDMPIVPIAILDRRMKKKKNQAITEVLIQWAHTTAEEATWLP
ncbi:hypothetical protein L6164_004329 [Bauhinia variegata]|uniref:Uncharacterized protein n=1 Tax=Bauhinia variegata TaxID=167791 RepID=A0ACB9Q5L0_BAUVA|nr:hypothetical protein L6164_004329 [Bauhinia variegata]